MEKLHNQRLKAIEDRLEKIERQLQNGAFHDFKILTIHHLSATGGTLISKCLAAMPNVVLLSEINPIIKLNSFNPFDPIQQLKKYNFLSDEDYQNIFLDRIALIVDKCIQHQKKLIIRDHSHSDFLGGQVKNPPSLLNTISERYKFKPLIVESAGINSKDPICQFSGSLIHGSGVKERLNRGGWNWFLPSPSALYRMMREAGFDDVQTQYHSKRVYGYGKKVSQVGICKAGLSVPNIK